LALIFITILSAFLYIFILDDDEKGCFLGEFGAGMGLTGAFTARALNATAKSLITLSQYAKVAAANASEGIAFWVGIAGTLTLFSLPGTDWPTCVK